LPSTRFVDVALNAGDSFKHDADRVETRVRERPFLLPAAGTPEGHRGSDPTFVFLNYSEMLMLLTTDDDVLLQPPTQLDSSRKKRTDQIHIQSYINRPIG
jgi:hypothetical protein